jgi:tetratricopeptide (TPR) repeat protein
MKLSAKRITRKILALAALASIFGCATGKAASLGSSVAVLRGMAYNEDRMPVQDANVEWMIDGKIAKSAKTDIHGRYLIPDVALGPVSLRFEKPGYENLDWSFAFEKPTQVVYAQMANLNELLDNAADLIERRDWNAAASFLIRAKKLDGENIVAIYLGAEIRSRQGDHDGAAAMLEKLSAEKSPSFAVELSLAALYQDKLQQPDKALIHLKKALTIQDDIDVENRIASLEKKEGAGLTQGTYPSKMMPELKRFPW